jgi:Mrp family chromosome partitioning ATPase
MRQFKHRVNTIGARIYGVVLNGIKAGSSEYYYYGSGYYNYYARPHDDESTPYLNEEAREEREGKEV